MKSEVGQDNMEDFNANSGGGPAPLDSRSQSLVDLAERIDRTRGLAEASAVVVQYAVASLGADVAGLALREPDRSPVRLAATSAVLAELDAVETALRQGPGTARLLDGSVVTITDTHDDTLWPEWSDAAASRGLRSVRYVGMPPIRGRWATLELFSRRPHAAAIDRLIRVDRVAKQAGLALRHVDRIANLEDAMRTRALIGQAQGILMERYRLTSEQAMSYLRRSSQSSQVKVRDLAERLVHERDHSSAPPLPLPGVEPPAPRRARRPR